MRSSRDNLFGPLRVGRSLGDGNEGGLLQTGVARGQSQGRQPADGLVTKPVVKGWNGSTRASPGKKGKENRKGSKATTKFQHVQSRLGAPVFAKKRQNTAYTTTLEAAASHQREVHTAENQFISSADEHDVYDEAFLPAAAEFVTTRRGSMMASPFREDSRAYEPFPTEGMSIKDTPDAQVEGYAVSPSGSPRRLSHPSVAALYQYAQEVRTPTSRGSKHVATGTPTECADMIKALEDAAGSNLPEEAQSEELAGSFEMWLDSMGMAVLPLSEAATSRLRTLWLKAKEATELQLLIDNLKESELQLAQQEADDSAHHLGMLMAENHELLDAQARLRRQLLEAEERLSQLASAQMLTTSRDNGPQRFAAGCPEQPESPALGLCHSSLFADTPVTEGLCHPCGPSASNDSDNQKVVSQQYYGAVLTTQAVSSPTLNDAISQDADDNFSSARFGATTASPAASPASISVHPMVGVNAMPASIGDVPHAAEGDGSSPSLTSSAAPAAANSPTDSLSIVSRTPEHVPFMAWAGQATLERGCAFTAAPTSQNSTLTPTGPPAPLTEVLAADTPASAGLSMVSQPPQPVAFSSWAHDSTRNEFPGFTASPTASDRTSLPQPSAGLSILSQAQPAVNYGAWAEAQPQGECSPSVCSTPLESQPSAGLSMVSQPPHPLGYTSWAIAQAENSRVSSLKSTPFGPFVPPPSAAMLSNGNVSGLTSPADFRSNPLFESDSAPSSLAATPLPQRSDALPGLSVVPRVDQVAPAVPSLASTPMSEHSQALRSPVSSPGWQGSIGSPLAAQALFRGGSESLTEVEEASDAVAAVDEDALACEVQPAATQSGSAAWDQSILSFGIPVVHGPLPSLVPSCTDTAGVATTEYTAVGVEHTAVGVDPAAFSPARLADTEGGSSSTLQVQGSNSPTGSASFEVKSPADEQVPTEDHPASCSAAQQESDVDVPRRSSYGGAGSRRASYPDTPDALWPPSPTSIYATPLDAFPSPATLSTLFTLSRNAAARVLASAATPNSHAYGAAQTERCSPASFRFNLGGQPSTSGGSDAFTFNIACGLGIPGASGEAGTPTVAACASAAPNTAELDLPAAAASDTPLSFSFGLFPGPRASKWHETSVSNRLAATPGNCDAVIDATASDTPASFSFNFNDSQREPLSACGTPEVVIGRPSFGAGDSDGADGTPDAMPAPVFHVPNAIASGSPLPLAQLTPVQVRMLDELAGKIALAMSPPPRERQQLSTDAEPASPLQPPGAFSLAQLLASLQSPLPAAARRAPEPLQPNLGTAKQGKQTEARPIGRCEAAVEPCAAGPQVAGAPPAIANMDNLSGFSHFMAFLSAAGLPPAGGCSQQRVEQGSGNPAGIEAAATAVAAYSVAQLLAHLTSPGVPVLRRHADAPTQVTLHAGGNASVVLGLAVPPVPCDEADSPAMDAEHHSSPAASEAASFGFSTAAKLSTHNRPKASPSMSRNGPYSAVAWPNDAALMSAGLSTVTFGRAHRQLPSPISLRIPALDAQTPAAASKMTGAVEQVASDTKSFSLLLQAAMSPVPPSSADGPAATAAGGAQTSPRVAAQEPRSAAKSLHSPTFSFGGQLQGLQACGTPTAFFGPAAAAYDGCKTTPARTSVRPQVDASPGLSLGAWGFPAASAISPGEASVCGGIGASPAASEFSFGCGTRAHAAFVMGTPDADGPLAVPKGKQTTPVEVLAKLPANASPGLSLGAWGIAGSPGPASVNRAYQASPGVSEFSFGFGAGAAPCAMGTPVWADLSGAREGEVPCDKATAEDATPSKSPTLAFAAPHMTAAPGASAFLAALLGNLHSPMVGAVRIPRPTVEPVRMQQLRPLELGQHESPMDASSTPLASVDEGGAEEPITAQPAAVSACSLGAFQSASAEPLAAGAAVAIPLVAGGCDVASATKAKPNDDIPPPPYEALPDLIACGLCLPAPSSAPLPSQGSVASSAPPTCSSVGENATPPGFQLLQPRDAHMATMLAEASLGAAGSVVFGSPTRLFTPLSNAPGSPDAPCAAPLAEALLIESVSGSCGSPHRAAATIEAGRTTEPSPMPTPARVPPSPTSALSAAPRCSVENMHTSPVLAFSMQSNGTQDQCNMMPAAAALDTEPTEAVVTGPIAEATPTGDVRDSIRGFCSSAASTPVSASLRGTSPGPANSTATDVGFSLDAVQRLLFDSIADQEQEASVGQPFAGASPPSEKLADAARAAVATNQQPEDTAALACTPRGRQGTMPAATPQVHVSPGSLLSSPKNSLYRGLPSPGSELTPFSCLYDGGPVPHTPPTAELASTAKALSLLPEADSVARLSAVATGTHSNASSHFWAPGAGGPRAAGRDRVTLESVNRRISASADLLLDFQGSPGRPVGAPQGLSVTGAVAAARTSAQHMQASAVRKGWAPAAGPTVHTTMTVAAKAAAQPVGAAVRSSIPTAPAVVGSTGASMPCVAGQQVMRAGMGTSVQPAIMAAGGVMAQTSGPTNCMHMPLSQRLGLWPAGAVWGVPVAPAQVSVAASKHGGTVPVAAAVPQQRQQNRPEATPAAQVLAGRPRMSSRDAQTTPGLAMLTAVPMDTKGGSSAPFGRATAAVQTTPAPGPAATAAALPSKVFRSRIPAPGSVAVPSAATAITLAMPSPNASVASTSTVPDASSENEADGETEGAFQEDRGTSPQSSPGQRILRRHKRLLAAAAGGPQRVPVPRAASRTGKVKGPSAAAVDDEEVRRRAHVLGMRISPYLRPKRR